jgi:hypothetical protein
VWQVVSSAPINNHHRTGYAVTETLECSYLVDLCVEKKFRTCVTRRWLHSTEWGLCFCWVSFPREGNCYSFCYEGLDGRWDGGVSGRRDYVECGSLGLGGVEFEWLEFYSW